ncbi:MAG: CAP domain-containing protein [Gammaproteobacteria bacterium]
MSEIRDILSSKTCFTLFVSIWLTAAYAQDEQTDGYDYLNELRTRAGMITLSRNGMLEIAAGNHSQYLVGNSTAFLRYSGHFENPGDAYFTGNQASDRTAAAGYLSTLVSENVSNGQPDVFASIDDLMSAIYHRFGFLGFSIDEVGLGFVKDSGIDYSAYTYNMGNSGLNNLCMGSSFNEVGSFFQGICAQDSSFRISTEGKSAAEELFQGQNPYIVTWPSQGDSDVPPAFFEESPDPLPDYSVSGYPISLQFNPLVYNDVSITSFRLFEDSTNLEITNTRLLDNGTDPNMKFSALEYALFPLERLDWNSVYRVEVDYDSNMESDTLIWKFATRHPGAPLFEYAGHGTTVEIPANAASNFAFYVSPEESYPTIGGIGFSYSAGLNIDVDYIDGNTLSVSMVGAVGQRADFNISGRSFSLLIGNEADLPDDPEIDLSIGGSGIEDETAAHFDETNGILTLPLLVVDDALRAGVTLQLLDAGALTFKVDEILPADETSADEAVFTSSTLTMSIPRVKALGMAFSIEMKMVDTANLVLQITAAAEVAQ